ncbi:Hypothetical protein CINCED_3A022035 [Cinara cedri]|uniref:Uncharacterized protein n=1 Tax=Cinara cedri TaxID=506608 RepID=A0A5E4NBT9_9HEMI|nr:Hypothetical protein CINCED_3A022035 [Cinara cedri]
MCLREGYRGKYSVQKETMKENMKYGTTKCLEEIYNKPSIFGTMKNTRRSWAGHVWRSEVLIKQITARKPNKKIPGERQDPDKDGHTEKRKIRGY